MVLSNSGHDHIRNSLVSFKDVAQLIRVRSKRLGHPRFLLPKGMYFGGFELRFPVEEPHSYEHV